jgi:hypothetical protein
MTPDSCCLHTCTLFWLYVVDAEAKEEEAEAGVPRGFYHHGGVSGADAHGSGCRKGCCGTRGGRCIRCCANADEIPEPMYRPAVEVHN